MWAAFFWSCLCFAWGRWSCQAFRHEIGDWMENRLMDCIFCMDYDDYKRMSIFGCTLKQTPTCKGNACYMRQHKRGNYFLYTSGCLNLTKAQFDGIQQQAESPEVKPDRESKTATQLCEVTASINTCLCTNRFQCNNVSSVEPFTEYTVPVFNDLNFDEVAHFRYFLPNDPVLESIAQTGQRDEYFLIKSVNPASPAFSPSALVGAKGLPGLRCTSTISDFQRLPVHEQFNLAEGESITAHQFNRHLYAIFERDFRSRSKENFFIKPEGTRTMAESYSRFTIPLSDPQCRTQYLSHGGSVRVGRLLEECDFFCVWLSYTHCQGRENWGKRTKYPVIFVTACVERLDLHKYDFLPDKDITLQGHVCWTGKSSVECLVHLYQEDRTGQVSPVLTAKFIMINLGKSVPQLVLENDAQRTLFELGAQAEKERKEQKKRSYLVSAPDISDIGDLHKLFIRRVQNDYQVPSSLNPAEVWIDETVRKSTVCCFPENQNMYGKVFGGFLMRQAFELAAINSKLFARERTECIAMDDVVFLEGIDIGDSLELAAKVTYTEEEFIQMRVFVQKVKLEGDQLSRKTTNTFHLTFVTRGKTPVRKVVPRTYMDGLLYLIGKKHLRRSREEAGL